MPVRRKQQILAKIETSEGQSANPGAADAVQIFEPNYSDSVDQQNRVPSGGSLSRDFTPLGRSTRQITFETDFRGSGDTSAPIDEPEWSRFLKSAGYKLSTLKSVTVGAVTGSGFQVGEIVQQSAAIRGVVVGCFQSGSLVDQLAGAGGILVVAVLTGTFTGAATDTAGESSGSTASASAVADYAGVCYQPTSERLVNVTTGAWTGTDPAAEGEVLDVLNTLGQVVGGVQIITDNGSMTDLDVTLLWGSMSNGDDLRSAADGTATINAAPVQISTPSLTIRHNLDGRQRDSLGARCDFNLQGDVGQPMVFQWTATGDLGPAIDAAQIATTGLSAIRPPRLFGAICAYGLGADLRRLTTKNVGLANGGNIAPNLDANRAGGSTGSNVVDRDPALSFSTDQVHSAFDWEAARDNRTAVRVAWLLGDTPGNIVGVVAPNCQVTEATPGDSDGIATFDITANPRRVLESGDDEVFIFQL